MARIGDSDKLLGLVGDSDMCFRQLGPTGCDRWLRRRLGRVTGTSDSDERLGQVTRALGGGGA